MWIFCLLFDNKLYLMWFGPFSWHFKSLSSTFVTLLLLFCLWIVFLWLTGAWKCLVWNSIRMQLFDNGTVNSWHFAGRGAFRQNDYMHCTSIIWSNQNKASLIGQYLMINTFPWNSPSLLPHLRIDKWCSFTLMSFFWEQEARLPVTASCWIQYYTWMFKAVFRATSSVLVY